MDAQKEETILETIMRRRTATRFLEEPVPSGTIEQILEMAMCAPSRLGRRPWEFVIIRDPNIRGEMRRSLRVPAGYGEAPVLVAVIVAVENGHQWDLDAGAATQSLLIAATAHGVGSAWIANPVSAEWAATSDWLCQTIGAPENARLVALVGLGYTAEQPPARRPADVYDRDAVHFERIRVKQDTERGQEGSLRPRFGEPGIVPGME